MIKKDGISHKQSSREMEQAAMLEEALRRPGVTEVMKVYESWKQIDNGLDVYRAATKKPQLITTTNHANTC